MAVPKTATQSKYVPMKNICEELTAYGFSYKWGNCAPIIQPWRLTEAKARKAGMLFEGEKAIRRFWEEKVRPRLPDELYSRRDVQDADWVQEARRILGFDGPDFKDRFTKKPSKKAGAAAPPVSAPAPAPAVHAPAPPVAAPASDSTESAPAPNPAASAASRTSVGTGAKTATQSVASLPKPVVVAAKKAPAVQSAEPRPHGKENKKESKRRAESAEGEGVVLKKKVKKDKVSSAPPAPGTTGATTKRPAPAPATLKAPAPLPSAASAGTAKPAAGKMHIAGASSMAANAQAELFQVLFSRSSVLSALALERATALLQRGDPKIIGLLRAYKGKEVEEGKLTQFKRLLDTIISAGAVQY